MEVHQETRKWSPETGYFLWFVRKGPEVHIADFGTLIQFWWDSKSSGLSFHTSLFILIAFVVIRIALLRVFWLLRSLLLLLLLSALSAKMPGSKNLDISTRAEVVLLRALGYTNDQVVNKIGDVSPRTVAHWFNEAKRRGWKPEESLRLKDEWLTSAPKPGRPRKATEEAFEDKVTELEGDNNYCE